MQTELVVLALALLLGLAQLFLATGMATQIRGLKWNMSPRDTAGAPLIGKVGRCDRAFQNYKETFPFFAAAIFLVITTGRTNYFTQMGSMFYLGARVVYVPLYIYGIIGPRSLAWFVSILSILVILFQIIA